MAGFAANPLHIRDDGPNYEQDTPDNLLQIDPFAAWGEVLGMPGEQFSDVEKTRLAEAAKAISMFIIKSRDYGETADGLGSRGQFADIWRKVGKLRNLVWEGKQAQFEKPYEVVQDLVGHSILFLQFLRQGR